MTKFFGLVFGREHVKERLDCLDTLVRECEKDDHAFPPKFVYALWEELWATWGERLREKKRALLRMLQTDNPRKEDLKMIAFAPTADGRAMFTFPNVFDLESPTGYYQEAVSYTHLTLPTKSTV